MNKLLRYSFVALMAMMGLTVSAQGTTFDFDNDYAKLFPTLAGTSSNNSHDGDFTAATTSTAIDGFTVTVSAAAEGVTNANRIWSGAPRLRMYSGTLTISGKGIKKIEFTGHATNFNLSTTTGKLDGKTWTGEADEIVFTVAKNTQINKLVINGEESTEPDEPKTDEVITVAKALEIISGLSNGAYADGEYQVKGKVISVTEISTSYGNATFVIADEVTASEGLTVFRVKGFNGAKIEDENIVKKGDEVVVKGQLQKYAAKDGTVTPELATGGSIVSINGGTTGISTVKAEGNINAFIYNLAGQKVGEDYKGIVIENGKKLIRK